MLSSCGNLFEAGLFRLPLLRFGMVIRNGRGQVNHVTNQVLYYTRKYPGPDVRTLHIAPRQATKWAEFLGGVSYPYLYSSLSSGSPCCGQWTGLSWWLTDQRCRDYRWQWAVTITGDRTKTASTHMACSGMLLKHVCQYSKRYTELSVILTNSYALIQRYWCAGTCFSYTQAWDPIIGFRGWAVKPLFTYYY